jgi:HAD superfamily hydrolase (TIGR01509 family)
MPAAVLWDMDGTLVDTEPYWFAAEHGLVAAHGGTWTDDDAHSVVGYALIDSARVLRDRGGVDMDLEAIVETLLDDVIERCRTALPWRPGARELLTECRDAGVPCALVTMSWTRLADALVAAAPTGAFAAVVTGDVVGNGKPHPEPYLTAAREVGAAPARCIAIEDSPTGVASAVAAGCPTIAVPHMVPIEPRPGVAIRPTLEGLDLEALVAAAAAV